MTGPSFAPQWFSRPGDTVLTLMKKRGLSPAALAERTGLARGAIQGLLDGSAALDDDIAAKLSTHIGGSRAFWRARQAQYERDLETVSEAIDPTDADTWLRLLPIKQMRNTGWIEDTNDRRRLLQASLSYFDVSNPDEWKSRYGQFASEFRYRSSETFESTIGALAAWLRQGELQAKFAYAEPWDQIAFRRAIMEARHLTRTKNPASFIPRLRDLCAQCGVAILFVRTPPGCRASGASRFASRDRAMMILSFRYLSDDHFWFSFFHEAGHLVLHGQDKTFVDGDIAAHTREEEEANAFAGGVLIPRDRLDELLSLRARVEDIVRFAQRVGVSPGIVVGQMQHYEVIGPHQMNGLKRRFSWDQVTAASHESEQTS